MTNAHLIHRWFDEIWNKRDTSVVRELMSDDCISHGLMDVNGNPRRGPADFELLFNAFAGAFPDIRIDIIETVSQGDKVCVRCVVEGTHTGEGIGIPPTGRKVSFGGMCIVRVENGKFVEVWNQYDFIALYNQLDVLSLTLG
jgi:steroid delta-isomerase-like uncharacterized protein